MKLRTAAFAAIAAAAVAGVFAGASQAGSYGYRGYGYAAPVYGSHFAPTCAIVAKRSFVYGYGWVYRDVRICR